MEKILEEGFKPYFRTTLIQILEHFGLSRRIGLGIVLIWIFVLFAAVSNGQDALTKPALEQIALDSFLQNLEKMKIINFNSEHPIYIDKSLLQKGPSAVINSAFKYPGKKIYDYIAGVDSIAEQFHDTLAYKKLQLKRVNGLKIKTYKKSAKRLSRPGFMIVHVNRAVFYKDYWYVLIYSSPNPSRYTNYTIFKIDSSNQIIDWMTMGSIS